MPRKFISPETAERQTPDEILEWRDGIVEALLERRGSVKDALRADSKVPARFAYMTEAEVETHFDALRREADRLTMLNLVASVEATITVDYFRRVEGKLKDDLSKSYRRWHKDLPKSKKKRPDFDKPGILAVLRKTHIVGDPVIDRYRECLQARHWVGHGRHWPRPIMVDQLDPEEVHARALALWGALPA